MWKFFISLTTFPNPTVNKLITWDEKQINSLQGVHWFVIHGESWGQDNAQACDSRVKYLQLEIPWCVILNGFATAGQHTARLKDLGCLTTAPVCPLAHPGVGCPVRCLWGKCALQRTCIHMAVCWKVRPCWCVLPPHLIPPTVGTKLNTHFTFARTLDFFCFVYNVEARLRANTIWTFQETFTLITYVNSNKMNLYVHSAQEHSRNPQIEKNSHLVLIHCWSSSPALGASKNSRRRCKMTMKERATMSMKVWHQQT